jgi:CrcB protein
MGPQNGTPPTLREPVAPETVRAAHPGRGLVVAVVAVGGAGGACARYGASLMWPTVPGTFPWTTWGINVLGCLVIGVFLTVITELRSTHPLVRPFFGTGVLGGFTTFSTYTVDIQHLADSRKAGLALLYLVATATAALCAVWVGATATRLVSRIKGAR